MGTKLGAWITLYPFHEGGKLPAGVTSEMDVMRASSLLEKGWYADGPWPTRGAVGKGCPDATVAYSSLNPVRLRRDADSFLERQIADPISLTGATSDGLNST